MEYIKLRGTDLSASRIILGCMRIADMRSDKLNTLLRTALDSGINFFDHADIYGGGRCESAFSATLPLSDSLRDKMILQTKCGIRKGFYDQSEQHIIESVEGSLKRLQTDRIDILLLHRPDTLAQPQEIAKAFQKLKQNGKVRYFGVSNHNPSQIQLLQSYIDEPLMINQLQFGPAHTGLIDSGLTVNNKFENASDRDGHVLNYCRTNNITIQAWSPFQHGYFDGLFIHSANHSELTKTLENLADKYGTGINGITAAWILRHPAKMQMISGSTSPHRISETADATGIIMSREDWYAVYRSAGNTLP